MYKYVKKLKEGELSEGENKYDVNQIEEETLQTFLDNGFEESTEEEYLENNPVEESTEEVEFSDRIDNEPDSE